MQMISSYVYKLSQMTNQLVKLWTCLNEFSKLSFFYFALKNPLRNIIPAFNLTSINNDPVTYSVSE